jgi:hypothetical protein
MESISHFATYFRLYVLSFLDTKRGQSPGKKNYKEMILGIVIPITSTNKNELNLRGH